jgi:hypothetical protein
MCPSMFLCSYVVHQTSINKKYSKEDIVKKLLSIIANKLPLRRNGVTF